MSKFKVGQKILCIDNDVSYGYLELNKVYTVTKCTVHDVSIQGSVIEWFPERFIDAEKFIHDDNYNKKLESLINE